MTLTGKKALVTGASRGIGAAIAKKLATEGADVAITYSGSADSAANVVREIQALGRRAIAIHADSANVVAVQGSVERAVAELGGLDILVNNAGILRIGDVKDMSLEDIEALLNINFRSPIIAAKAAIPHLGAGGRIVNIGSYFADGVPFSVVGIYAATKSALVALTKGLARELGSKDITVNLVQPGPINTDMNPHDGPFSSGQAQLTALGKFGHPEDIADAVAYLASSQAKYVTGATLSVDGGINA